MRKHSYTEAEAPTNTGSVTRPARYNLRLTCQARGRTHSILIRLREQYPDLLPKDDTSEASVWEHVCLPILEHHERKLRIGDSATRAFVRAQAKPLPVEDHVKNLAQRMLPGFAFTRVAAK